MTTQEDRYSRDYNMSFSNNGEYNRAPPKEGNMSFGVNLKNEISKCMKGFRATNVITYQRCRDKCTWQRPGEVISLFSEKDDEDEFTPDPKGVWPISQNMNSELPIKEITKRHRVIDRDWTVPPSNKKFKQPEPVYPQSTGVKLRPVEDIMNEYSKASQYKPPAAITASTKPALALGKNIPRVQDKTNCLLEPIPDKIKGVLQNITETTRRKPTVGPVPTKQAPKIYASKAESNDKNQKSTVPRRSSLLKSGISSENLDSKKPPAPVNVAQSTNASSARPRISSKSIPITTTTVTEKTKYAENIPDLIEARKYLLGDLDEVELRNLKNLAQAPRVTHDMKRPSMCLYFPKVIDEMNKIKPQRKPRSGKTVAVKSTKPSVNKKNLLNNVQQEQQHQEKVALQSASTTKRTNSSRSTTKPASINKSIKTDSAQPSKKIPTKVDINTTSKNINTNNSTPIVTKKSLSEQNSHSQSKEEAKPAIVPEEEVYPSSVSAEFLKSIKIPKRVNKVTEMELEEGETISPSPSPIRTQNDNIRKPSRSSISSSSSNINSREVAVDDNESSRKRTSRRRDEERSTKRDEERSSSSRRESRSESRRDRSHRPRSRSRSRSPNRDRHRSSSRTHHRSDRPERKTSPEPSRERCRSPMRTERDSHKRKSSSSDNDTNSTTSSHTLSKRHGEYEPAAKRQATEKKVLPSVEENDKKYTTSNNNNNTVPSSSSKSINSTNRKLSINTIHNNNTTPKLTSTPAATSTTTKPTVVSTTTTKSDAASIPTTNAPTRNASIPPASTENTLSATAPNAETPEQYKIFTIMFNKSAHASKRRGDTETDSVLSMLDHFHALCDYILNFYYVDKANPQVPFKQASIAWKSLFPFCDSLIKRLEAHRLNDLYGLCVRLISLIRYYIYSRMESSTRPLLTKQLINANDESYTDRSCIEMTEGLLREHEKAERCYVDSERFLTYGTIATQFPDTFKNVCINGNVLAGIMLGGEAGVSVGAMFPFTPYSPLHHAAIASKCLLSEYVTKNKLRYTPISHPEEFM